MSILSTREWATLIWGLLFLVYIMCHKEIRKSFWKVIVIFFDKKLRILWEIILLYVLAITMIFYRSSIWEYLYQGYYYMVSFFRAYILYERCFK